MAGLPLDAIPIGIALSQRGMLLQANAAFRRLFGHETGSELLGRSLIDHVAFEQRDFVQALNQERERTGSGPSEYETMGLRKNGSTFPMQIQATTVPVAEGLGTLAFITDISERKRAEEALRKSEHRVRAKLDAILTPEGSIESLELADVINVPAIQEIMDQFHRLTGFGCTISDLSGKVLVGSGLQEICVQYHRAHQESAKNCFESDLILSEGVEAGGFKTYMCKNNLGHVVTPIYVGNRHLGNIFLGQFFFDDEPVDIEVFKDQARRFGFDEARYLRAMEKVPRWKREAVDNAIRYYSQLATLISEQGYGRIKLAQALAEQQRAEETLKRQNAMLSSLLKTLPMGVFMVEAPSGKPLVANDVALELLGQGVHPDASNENPQAIHETYQSDRRTPYPQDELPIQLGMKGIASHVDDLLVVHPGGAERLLEVFGTPVTDDEGTIWASLVSFFDITDRKRAEEELAQTNLLLEQSQILSKLGAWALDLRTGQLTWTPETYRLHEVDPAGFTPTLETALAFYEPESRPVILHAVELAMETGQRYNLEAKLRTAKGQLLWIRTIGTAVFEEGRCVRLLGTIQNITERKQAEAALKQSEDQIRVIFETSEAGIILVSPVGSITFANQRMAEMVGMTLQELIGTTYRDLLHESEKQLADTRLQMIISKEIPSVSVERKFLRTDGTTFWGHLSGRRLENPDGSVRALVGIITDVTKRREAEEQQQFLQTQLHQAQKMESLGALAGGVAHDMNNVLGAILGLASAHIEAQPAGSPVQKAFGTIIKAAERGGNMLKSLLSFARQNSAEDRDLDLNTILREEVRLLEHTTLSKVRLVMDLDPELRLIRADPGALTHAFMNLCVNAVDAMPEQGTLTLRTRNHGPGWVEVEVQDTGTGMPPEVLAKALDPFFTTKDVGKGTGLGLSIVYSTVKSYHGEMELQSEPGRGTRVIVRLPAIHKPTPPVEPSGAYQTMPRLGALNVLLVDDDELIQGSIQGMLEQLGHRATLARSGEDALALLASGHSPDVVILDMNMPGLGGAGTLPRLRALRPVVPVLLATGRADQIAQDLVKAHPYVTLLSKPFGMKELQVHLAPFLR